MFRMSVWNVVRHKLFRKGFDLFLIKAISHPNIWIMEKCVRILNSSGFIYPIVLEVSHR